VDNQELLNSLELAMDKQVFDLRALLSSLVEEEKKYPDGSKEEVFEIRLKLLESYEDAESKSLYWMNRYLISLGLSHLKRNKLKVDQLSDFKKAISVNDLSLAMKVDQLISLLNKIHETNQNLKLLDQLGVMKLPLERAVKKKPKIQVGVIN